MRICQKGPVCSAWYRNIITRGYEEDCFGWDADDNVDFQPHQVDNGWDEISDNEQQQKQQQQQRDEEVTVSIGNVIVAADAPIAHVSVADSIPVAGHSSKRRKTSANAANIKKTK